MASSRIFVQGIPPSMSAGELKQHFCKQGVVTDAKTLGNRRIGYIGYKTAEEAAKALKYFNKSYLRMSKLSVELARPASQCKSRELNQITISNEVEPGENFSGSRKRKRQNVDEVSFSDRNSNTKSIDLASEKAYFDASGTVGCLQDIEEKSTTKLSVYNQSTDQDATADRRRNDYGSADQTWLKTHTRHLSNEYGCSQALPESKSSRSEYRESVNANGNDSDLKTTQTARRDLTRSTASQGPYNRLFLRNLSYTLTEEDIREGFALFGDISEINVPINSSGTSKGFAFVQYHAGEDAERAHKAMDDTIFHGRLLQVLASEPKRSKFDEFEISKLPLKQQMLIRRKAESSSKVFSWNSLYMNPDAVITYISNRLGVSKAEVLDPSSSDAAVIQARAESLVIEETRKYFLDCGVDLDAFKNTVRSDRGILVKNLSYGTSADEVLSLFADYGETERFLMPPSGMTAIVVFKQRAAAKAAFKAFSYRKFRDSILFFEWAPKTLFSPTSVAQVDKNSHGIKLTANVNDEMFASEAEASTLYVRNLNFSTTNSQLTDLFQGLNGFLSATIKTKPNPKDTSKNLSMGYGFLEFRTQAQAKSAMNAMQGYNLGGHNLIIKVSDKAKDTFSRNKIQMKTKVKQGKTKIVVKNLPFEVSKEEIRSLFASYGQLRSLRLPQKIDRTSRGFAFVEFATTRDAENTMEALKHTHVLGRRLVLQFAAEDVEDPEKEIEKIQKKVNTQIDKITLENMASTMRRKVNFQGINGE